MSRINSSYISPGSNQYRILQDAINSLNFSKKNELENILLKLYEDHRITANKREEFEETFEEISNRIKRCFPNVTVCLYGSHVSGLANEDSDLDITILFRDGKQFTYLPKSKIKTKLETIYLYFRQKYSYVKFISTAKIPIVKFQTRNGINADISINNFHAIRNSNLLKTYSDLDSRVIVLGQLLKQFIKFYTNGDAYRDVLTSYGHMLMLIHYLQTKGVLRVLRKDIDYDANPDFLNCDEMYPYSKMKKASRNCKKSGFVDLWIGFFKYYTMEFKIRKHVVSITQSNTVPKIIKSRILSLSIKDPIDLLRDLGIHLNSTSVKKILKSFIKVLLHKGNIDQMISGFSETKISEKCSESDETEQSASEDESNEYFKNIMNLLTRNKSSNSDSNN